MAQIVAGLMRPYYRQIVKVFAVITPLGRHSLGHKIEAGQMAFFQQRIRDEVGHDELVIRKATRRVLGQKYVLFRLPDTRQLIREI